MELPRMDTEAYKEWMNIFDSDVSVIWNREKTELQRAAMLFGALQKEFKRVHAMVDMEYLMLKQKLKDKHSLEDKNRSTPLKYSENSKRSNKENEIVTNTRPSSSLKNGLDIESPDMFKNIENNDPEAEITTNSSIIIDLSLSDDDKTRLEESPTLISKRRKHRPKHSKMCHLQPPLNQFNTPECVRKNIFQTEKSDCDNSIIIESTPDLKIKKSDSRLNEFLTKKTVQKSKNRSSLTQICLNTSKLELTRIEKADDGIDSDETCIDGNKSKSKMGITELLEIINEDETDKAVPENYDEFEEMDSMQDSDQFSNAAFLDENICAEGSSPKKPRLVEPEPIVRGHARKYLNGFSCKQCRDFYTHMNLSPKELQKKMDECSRHRYTYRPPEDTIPGYWDMTIPSQNDP